MFLGQLAGLLLDDFHMSPLTMLLPSLRTAASRTVDRVWGANMYYSGYATTGIETVPAGR